MTVEAPPFSVRALIRQTVDGSGLVEPAEVAAKVAESIPDELLRLALAQVLPSYVQTVFGGNRSSTRGGQPFVQGPSRADRVRNWYQQFLAQPLQVNGAWKRLGECTSTDLVTLAADRRDIARRNERIAAEFDLMATQLKRRKVTHVCDLPAEVVEKIVRPTP